MDKKALAVVGIGVGCLALGGLAGGLIGHSVFPNVSVETKIIDATEAQKKASFDEGVLSVKPAVITVEKNITQEIKVDNGKLDMVLQHIYDNDGAVEYLTADLKDTEVNKIVDRVVFINDIKSLASNYVKDKAADEVDREVVSGTTLREDDIDKVRVYDEDDKIAVSNVDFEDKDAYVTVKARIEQDDKIFDTTFKVEIRDGEVDDMSIVEITKRD